MIYDKKSGEYDWDVKPGKVAPMYKEPKSGCPTFIMKDPKCKVKGVPEWGVNQMGKGEIVFGRIPEKIRDAKPDSNWVPKASIDDEDWGTDLDEPRKQWQD